MKHGNRIWQGRRFQRSIGTPGDAADEPLDHTTEAEGGLVLAEPSRGVRHRV
jgi:hypothetical protein